MLLLNKKLQNTGLEKELPDTLKMQEGTQKELLLWNHIQKIFITSLPGQQQNKDLSFDYQRLLPELQNLSNTLLDTGKAAALCHLSPGYFSVLFKKKFGMSFGKYERNFRLNGAEGDIRKGCSLKEAASFWDFCDKSHLARLLKKRK